MSKAANTLYPMDNSNAGYHHRIHHKPDVYNSDFWYHLLISISSTSTRK